ncbi:MAG: hypothetical protein JXX28_13000 [Deltaproteobacteria bacterium]|nr:hypothetical protein [Deltaproteobacteria bacterium]
MRSLAAVLLALAGCNPDPGDPEEGVEYRDGITSDYETGERGSLKISEIFWSGSVQDDGTWDASDVFIEIRNEGTRPMDISRWRLVLEGETEKDFRLPQLERDVEVGEHVFFAAKTTGCFPSPDGVIEGLEFPFGGAFYLSLQDVDEHIIDSAGDRGRARPAYSGGYDLLVSRSMERVEMMFGANGDEPHAWHYYTPAPADVPNNDRVLEGCRTRTLASPGRPNSPDYSGAFASGSLE